MNTWHAPCPLPSTRTVPDRSHQHASIEDLEMLNLFPLVAERPQSRRWLAAAAGLAMGLVTALPANAQDTIKVGILHSLSGTMAISKTTLKDVMLMLIDEQNK